MNSTLNVRRLVLIMVVAVFAVTAMVGPAAATSEPAFDSSGLLFQTDSGNVTDTENEGESQGDDDDPDDTDDDEDSDDESGESNVTEDELDELPIDVTEEDVNLDELEGESENDDNSASTGGDDGSDSDDDGGTPQIGGGGGTGAVGPSFSPEDNAERLSEWLSERLHEGMIMLIDDVFNTMLGTPVPENDGWQGILGQPVGDTYSELYENVYMQMILPPVFQFMILGFIFFSLFVVPFSPITGRRVWSVLLAMFGAGALILLAWNFVSLLHHVSDAVTMWFLPQGEEMLAGADGENVLSEENIELASGPLAVILGTYTVGLYTGLFLAFIHGMRHVVLFLMPTILPIILVGMYFGPRTSKAAFSVLFWQYIDLLVMNWPTALLLSIAYSRTHQPRLVLLAHSQLSPKTVFGSETLPTTCPSGPIDTPRYHSAATRVASRHFRQRGAVDPRKSQRHTDQTIYDEAARGLESASNRRPPHMKRPAQVVGQVLCPVRAVAQQPYV